MATDKTELRHFGVGMGLAITVVFGVVLPFLFGYEYPLWPWVTGCLFAGGGLFFTTALKPLYSVWMPFAHGIGWLNTRIILGAVFLVLFIPFGVVFRVIGKDAMARKFDKKLESYRVIRTNEGTHTDFERPY